ncbi:MAG: agmatine/peptidylarginine deiminase [Chthoniobacterales bacterium]
MAPQNSTPQKNFSHPVSNSGPSPVACSLLPASAYSMPAEWEKHEASWISWPHREGKSFPGSYDAVIPTFVAMAAAIAESEILRINVRDAVQKETVQKLLARVVPPEHLEFYFITTQEPWCRDHGPIFVRHHDSFHDSELAILDWDYNAWGKKYLPFDADNAVPSLIAKKLNMRSFQPGMVLEGGSIEVNGAGALLTTESCLLNKNRNPGLSRSDIEENLKKYLGVTEVFWLGDGIEGDDTDGHIDDITRFVAEEIVVTAIEKNPHDPNYEPLRKNRERLCAVQLQNGKSLTVVELPMPPYTERQGERLPASHANFFITNSNLLLPAFGSRSDDIARGILADFFPNHKVIPIDCRELIWGLGAFHCLTQQQPHSSKHWG